MVFIVGNYCVFETSTACLKLRNTVNEIVQFFHNNRKYEWPSKSLETVVAYEM